MTKLIKQRQVNNYNIAYVVDGNEMVLGFTVAHLDMERATAQNFKTSALAQAWGDKNYKGLVCN